MPDVDPLATLMAKSMLFNVKVPLSRPRHPDWLARVAEPL